MVSTFIEYLPPKALAIGLHNQLACLTNQPRPGLLIFIVNQPPHPLCQPHLIAQTLTISPNAQSAVPTC